jgi:hypothetical protein
LPKFINESGIIAAGLSLHLVFSFCGPSGSIYFNHDKIGGHVSAFYKCNNVMHYYDNNFGLFVMPNNLNINEINGVLISSTRMILYLKFDWDDLKFDWNDLKHENYVAAIDNSKISFLNHNTGSWMPNLGKVIENPKHEWKYLVLYTNKIHIAQELKTGGKTYKHKRKLRNTTRKH